MAGGEGGCPDRGCWPAAPCRAGRGPARAAEPPRPPQGAGREGELESAVGGCEVAGASGLRVLALLVRRLVRLRVRSGWPVDVHHGSLLNGLQRMKLVGSQNRHRGEPEQLKLMGNTRMPCPVCEGRYPEPLVRSSRPTRDHSERGGHCGRCTPVDIRRPLLATKCLRMPSFANCTLDSHNWHRRMILSCAMVAPSLG